MKKNKLKTLKVSFECYLPPPKSPAQKFKRVCLEEHQLCKAAQKFEELKDGAYYCYCAYVLRISRYSSFLSVMLTNTGIFLCGLKLSGESR